MKLIPSKNLYKIKNGKDYILYNSIYGRALNVPQDVVNFINLLEGGREPKEILGDDRIGAYKNIIKDLRNRHFILGVKENEYAPLKSFLRRHKRDMDEGKLLDTLHLHVTSRCNFRCKYCYIFKITSRKEYNKDMSFIVAKQAVDEFIAHVNEKNIDKTAIVFFGGEPLLRWKLIKRIVDYVERIKIKPEVKYCLDTNGSIISPEIIEYIKKFNFGISVSLDGLEESNDKCRQYLSGNGTFNTVKNTLDILLNNKVNFKIESCLTMYNIADFEEFVDFLISNYGIKKISLELISHEENEADSDNYTVKNKAKRLVDIYKYCSKKGVYINGRWFMPIVQAKSEAIGSYPCGAIHGRMFHVKPTGDIFPCQKIRIKIGEISNFKIIFKDKSYDVVKSRNVEHLAGCKGCEIEGLCAGGCAGVVEYYSNNILDTSQESIRELCAIKKYVFKEIMKYQFTKRLNCNEVQEGG